MIDIKTINVFTEGDSSLLSTWSNIPYFLTTNLEKQGYTINRINIESSYLTQQIWNKIVFRLLTKLFRNNIYWYDRTFICYLETFIKIWFLNNKYSDADINLFISYSFYNPFSKKPNILFSDWDYETMIKDKRNRNPYFFEKWSMKRQEKVIKKADLVISLFAKAAEEMKIRYSKENVINLGNNVVNVFYDKGLNEKEILIKKQNSNRIIFIGSIKYIEGVKMLIDAFRNLKIYNPLLELVIIGINRKYLPAKLPEGITFHGYLDKGEKSDNQIYYNELLNAKILINPTPTWAGYSSTIEAMFFYTPIIVSPYSDFVTEFGNNIDFGEYCDGFNLTNLEDAIKKLLESENYKQICLNARNRVKDYTWENYIDKLIVEIQNIK